MNIEVISQMVGVIFLFVGCVMVGHAVSASVENIEIQTRVKYASIGFGILFGGILLA